MTHSGTAHGMVLRSGTEGDAAAAAALHADQIREGFLTFLGEKFLRRLYRRLARTPDSFLLIADFEGSAIGFLAGSTHVRALYRSFVWRDGVPATFACGGRLLRFPVRALETLRHGTGASGQGAELLAIAVDPSAQGRGAGTLLVEGFLHEVTARRETAAHVVVAADNDAATALYRKAGFGTVERFELHQGTDSLLMQWPTAPDGES